MLSKQCCKADYASIELLKSAVAVLYCTSSPLLLSRKCRAVAIINYYCLQTYYTEANECNNNEYTTTCTLRNSLESRHISLKLILTRSKTATFLGPLLQFSFFFSYLYIGIYYNVSKYTLDHLFELLKGLYEPLTLFQRVQK